MRPAASQEAATAGRCEEPVQIEQRGVKQRRRRPVADLAPEQRRSPVRIDVQHQQPSQREGEPDPAQSAHKAGTETHARKVEDLGLDGQTDGDPHAGHLSNHRETGQKCRQGERGFVAALLVAVPRRLVRGEARWRAQPGAGQRAGQVQRGGHRRHHPEIVRGARRPGQIRQPQEADCVQRKNQRRGRGAVAPPDAQQVEALEQQPVGGEQGLGGDQRGVRGAARDAGGVGGEQTEQRHGVPSEAPRQVEQRRRQRNQRHHGERRVGRHRKRRESGEVGYAA